MEWLSSSINMHSTPSTLNQWISMFILNQGTSQVKMFFVVHLQRWTYVGKTCNWKSTCADLTTRLTCVSLLNYILDNNRAYCMNTANILPLCCYVQLSNRQQRAHRLNGLMQCWLIENPRGGGKEGLKGTIRKNRDGEERGMKGWLLYWVEVDLDKSDRQRHCERKTDWIWGRMNE